MGNPSAAKSLRAYLARPDALAAGGGRCGGGSMNNGLPAGVGCLPMGQILDRSLNEAEMLLTNMKIELRVHINRGLTNFKRSSID